MPNVQFEAKSLNLPFASTNQRPVSRSSSDLLKPIRCRIILGDNIVSVDFVKKTTVKVNRNGSAIALAPIAHSDAGLFCNQLKCIYFG